MLATSWENPFGIIEETQLSAGALGSDSPSIFDTLDIPMPAVYPGGDEREPSYRQAVAAAKLLTFPTPQSVTPWPAGLTFDLAIGIDSTQTILERYCLSPEEYEGLMAVPAFRRELTTTMQKNQEEGITFSRKAAHIAEDCIPDMYAVIKDPLQTAATRADIWKYMAKVGNLEPKASKDAGGGSVPMVNIQINL